MIKHEKLTLVIKYVFALFMVGTGVMTVFFWFLDFDLSANTSVKTFKFMKAMQETGYMVLWLGIFKLVAGILIAIPKTSPLGILAAFPYSVNILLYVVFVAYQDYLLIGLIDFAICTYLVYAYSYFYRGLIVIKNNG